MGASQRITVPRGERGAGLTGRDVYDHDSVGSRSRSPIGIADFVRAVLPNARPPNASRHVMITRTMAIQVKGKLGASSFVCTAIQAQLGSVVAAVLLTATRLIAVRAFGREESPSMRTSRAPGFRD